MARPRTDTDEILDGWYRLRTDQPDLSGPVIAAQLGLSDGQLRGIVQRAQARGDHRAVPTRGNVGRPRHSTRPAVPFDPCTLDEGEQS